MLLKGNVDQDIFRPCIRAKGDKHYNSSKVNTECLFTIIAKYKAQYKWMQHKQNADSVHIMKLRKIFKENNSLKAKLIYTWVYLPIYTGKTAATHSCWAMSKKIWEKHLNENKGGDVIHSPGNTMVKNSKRSSTSANKSKQLTALNMVRNAVPLCTQLFHKRGRQCFVFWPS